MGRKRRVACYHLKVTELLINAKPLKANMLKALAIIEQFIDIQTDKPKILVIDWPWSRGLDFPNIRHYILVDYRDNGNAEYRLDVHTNVIPTLLQLATTQLQQTAKPADFLSFYATPMMHWLAQYFADMYSNRSSSSGTLRPYSEDNRTTECLTLVPTQFEGDYYPLQPKTSKNFRQK